MRRFVVRTVRGGRVKIGGKWYRPMVRPEEWKDPWLEFLTRWWLEGQRFAFARYQPTYEGVSLWGTEGYYRARGEEEREREWPGMACVGGTFLWEWWQPEMAAVGEAPTASIAETG